MNKLFYIACLALGALSLTLFYYDAINHSIFLWINAFYPYSLLWMTITNIGGFMCASCLLFILLRNNLQLLANVLLASLVLKFMVHGGKVFFSISRPEHLSHFPDLITLGPLLHDYSMPSGHTSTAFMAAMFIIRCYALQSWRLWLVIAFASLVGISRIAVGAHWPADVLAGAALGIFIGGIGANLNFPIRTRTIKYTIYLICLPFILLSIYHVTTITNSAMILTEGIIVLAGLIAATLWSLKLKQEFQNDGFLSH